MGCGLLLLLVTLLTFIAFVPGQLHVADTDVFGAFLVVMTIVYLFVVCFEEWVYYTCTLCTCKMYGELLLRLYCLYLCATLQKEKDLFNPARVISVASSLPNNVHTSRSITLLTSII